MPDIVSRIKVLITGDAKGLNTALARADGGLAGTLRKAALFGVLAVGVKKGFDLIDDTVDQADRAGDALSRITSSVGDVDADKIAAIADSFSDIGVSAPDFLEIAAGFSEFATASGKLKPDEIAAMAGGVAQFAGAMGRLKDVDPATLGDDIANFISGARGAAGAAKELGLPFDSALTPAERYAQLMERLPGLLGEVTGANAGLDDKQASLNAKWETFQAEVGPGVEDVLEGILDFTLDEIDAIPHAIEGFQMLGDAIVGMARTVAGPLGNVADLLRSITGAGQGGFNDIDLGDAGRRRESVTVRDVFDHRDRNGAVNDRIGGP